MEKQKNEKKGRRGREAEGGEEQGVVTEEQEKQMR